MSDLSDLEICKKIADIENVDYSINGEHVFYKVDGWPSGYNPLTDDALCFRLGAKYDMFPFLNKDNGLFESIYDMEELAYKGDGITSDKSPNRAICLAIISSVDKI